MQKRIIYRRRVRSRAPYGARGLKLLIGGAIGIFGRVAPRMGRVD